MTNFQTKFNLQLTTGGHHVIYNTSTVEWAMQIYICATQHCRAFRHTLKILSTKVLQFVGVRKIFDVNDFIHNMIVYNLSSRNRIPNFKRPSKHISSLIDVTSTVSFTNFKYLYNLNPLRHF